jgi:serine/threonine-protein kinase
LQACRGIAAAHAAGIIHRDLKPHNLFLCRRQDGTDLVKVLDFGIAKLEAFDDGLATRTGLVLGTPAYMSPEQARGDKDVDARADVYGLAAILYQLLSGDKPHPGASHNAILHHIATQPAVPLPADTLELPAALVAVVDRGLAADVGARFSSAEALADALAPFARREVWPAPEPPAATPVAEALPGRSPPAGASAGAPSGAPSSVSSAPRRIVAAAAIAAAVLVIGAAVAAIVGRSARHVARAEAPLASPVLAPSTRPVAAAPPATSPAPPVDPVAAATIPSPAVRPRPAAATGHPGAGGRPRGRPSGRPEPPGAANATVAKPAAPADKPGPPPVTFDQQNPYN